MKEKTIKDIIKIIDELTQSNDHNQALITASILLDNLQGSGETIRTKVLKHIREIQYLKGFMPTQLVELREESRKPIMNGLKRELESDIYNELENAF